MVRGLRAKVVVLLCGAFLLLLWVMSSLPIDRHSIANPTSLKQLPSVVPPNIEPSFPGKNQMKGMHGNNEDYDQSTLVILDEDNEWDESNQTPDQKLQKFIREGFTENSFRVFHLDLKGAPPNLDYLRHLLPFLTEHGCDCLLIEYEDMFPYTDKLSNISAKNAYKRQEIRKLLSWAHDLGMEVIPLVQTFGHLEHALKLEDWKHLRELPDFPSDLCPSRPGSIQLVENMITQVVSMHQGIKYIHLGGDEVIHLGACSECSQFNPWVLYTKYMTDVAQLIHRKYPGMTPIIWDDMMRQWHPEFLSTNPLENLVEVMVWDYGEVNNLIPPSLWYWYSKTFKRIWVASAFKGAELPTSDLPDLQARYRNTKAWLKKIENADVPIAGFVLTGWSRYDHFAVLCELLPSSVPSLLLNLIAISKKHVYRSDDEKQSVWRAAIKCPSSFSLESIKDNLHKLNVCQYPGVEVYTVILHYLILKAKTDTLYDTMTKNKAWLTPYNVKHNFSNVWRLVQDYTYLKTYSLLLDVKKFERLSKTILLKYFDIYGTNEWLEQRVGPLDAKLTSLGDSVEKLLNISTWPRRPVL